MVAVSESTRTYGAAVAASRSSAGMSQADLAGRAGVSVSMLAKVERGQRIPSPEIAERLAAALPGLPNAPAAAPRGSAAKKAAAKKTAAKRPAKKAAAKKTAAKRPAKKTAAKRAPARKAAAKRSATPAKAAAKKSAARKASATKAPAKRTAAKRTATTRAATPTTPTRRTAAKAASRPAARRRGGRRGDELMVLVRGDGIEVVGRNGAVTATVVDLTGLGRGGDVSDTTSELLVQVAKLPEPLMRRATAAITDAVMASRGD